MITIDDEFRINADSNCYILEKRVTIQNTESKNFGKEQYMNCGYYSNLSGALNGYVKSKTRQFISTENDNTLKELTQVINDLQTYIKTKLGDI